MHKSDIYVYSERKKGIEIIISMPWREEKYSELEKPTQGTGLEAQPEGIENSPLSFITKHGNYERTAISKFQKHILIVDDNQELRAFLKQTFEKHYHIYEAEVGNSAIEIAIRKIPYLIVSDVTTALIFRGRLKKNTGNRLYSICDL